MTGKSFKMKRGSEFVFGRDLQKPQEQDPVVRGVGVLSGLVVRACEVKVLVSLSGVQLFAIQWTVTLQDLLSLEFCR